MAFLRIGKTCIAFHLYDNGVKNMTRLLNKLTWSLEMWFPLSSPPSSSSSTEIQQEVEKTETQILPELVRVTREGGGVGGVLAQPNCSSFPPSPASKTDDWAHIAFQRLVLIPQDRLDLSTRASLKNLKADRFVIKLQRSFFFTLEVGSKFFLVTPMVLL